MKTGQPVFISDFVMLDLLLAVSLLTVTQCIICSEIVRCFYCYKLPFNAYHMKNSDLQWSQPLLYIHAQNADVHHNLNVSNPVPKV